MRIVPGISPRAHLELAACSRRSSKSRFCGTASRSCVLLVLLMLCIGVATGCTGRKSGAELASDALNRGLQAHSAGRLDEAATEYREVLVHDAQNKFAFYNLGLIDQTSGRP